MLRVTIKKENTPETWELEGKLAGEWVPELDRLWRQRTPQSGATIEILLKAVSYIDPAGKQLLAEMRQQGAEIRGCGCMVRAFVVLTLIFLAGFVFGGASILCAKHRPPVAPEIHARAAAAHR